MKPDLIAYNSLLHAYATAQIHYQATTQLKTSFQYV